VSITDYCYLVKGMVARHNSAAIGNVVGISDPTTKLCNIEKHWQRINLPKYWPRKALFAEKQGGQCRGNNTDCTRGFQEDAFIEKWRK
jgi:hypothetical protein